MTHTFIVDGVTHQIHWFTNQIPLKSRGILVKDACILIVKKPGSETYELPGGTHQPGENAEQCLIREVQEETSIKITKIEKFLGIMLETTINKIEVIANTYFYLIKDFVETPLEIDPDTGIIWELTWVNMENITQYIPWATIITDNIS